MGEKKTLDLIECLDVIEGLLKLSVSREQQIVQLTEENTQLKAQLNQGAQQPAGKPEEAPPLGESKSHKVLIIDDCESMRSNLANIFRSRGFEVVGEIKGGADILKMCRKHKPSIVTLNTSLDSADWYEVTRAIKNLDPHATVILISDIANELELLKAVQAGASDVIAKPVNSERLMKVVDILTAQRSLAR